jgi:hypothetical protein
VCIAKDIHHCYEVPQKAQETFPQACRKNHLEKVGMFDMPLGYKQIASSLAELRGGSETVQLIMWTSQGLNQN